MINTTPSNSGISVLVIEANQLYGECLCRILSQTNEFQVAQQSVCSLDRLETITEMQPNVVLLSCIISHGDLLKCLKIIRQESPNSKSLLHADELDEEILFQAMQLGARGCLAKEASIDLLVQAIKAVAAGELWVNRKVTAKLLSDTIEGRGEGRSSGHEGNNTLTAREREVLQLLAKGMNNKDIGESLFISDKTVKCHLNHIFKKIGVSSRFEAIVHAMTNGVES